MSLLIPRDDGLFQLLAELARQVTAVTTLLHQLLGAPERQRELAKAIKAGKHAADRTTHELIVRLDTVFVTPIDLASIHGLIARLENVIELVDCAVAEMISFHLKNVNERAVRLAGVLVRAGEALDAAVSHLRKPNAMRERIGELKLLEEEGDAVYEAAMRELFNSANEPLDVLRWKDIYDHLEDAIDECQRGAAVLEDVLSRNA
jgi:uncharacterized protein Yka (UPF0111/DUF47 family)